MNPAEIKPTISIDDVDKLDVRAGTIENVEEVAGSRKLLKLTVNFGDHHRSILSGMKGEREDPGRLSANRLCSLSISPVVRWRENVRKGCCSMSDMPTGRCPRSR